MIIENIRNKYHSIRRKFKYYFCYNVSDGGMSKAAKKAMAKMLKNLETEKDKKAILELKDSLLMHEIEIEKEPLLAMKQTIFNRNIKDKCELEVLEFYKSKLYSPYGLVVLRPSFFMLENYQSKTVPCITSEEIKELKNKYLEQYKHLQ